MSDITLDRAIMKVEQAIDSAITPAGIYIDPVLEAARLVANPNIEAAVKEEQSWTGLLPPIPIEMVAAIVAAALTPPEDTP